MKTNISKLLKYQYSWIFIPLLFILYIYLPNYRNYLQYPMFSVGAVGIIVGIIVLPPYLVIINLLGHLPMFIGLTQGLKYFSTDPIQFLFYLVGLLFIFYTPFWPYKVDRYTFAMTFTVVTFLYLCLAIYEKNKNNENNEKKLIIK